MTAAILGFAAWRLGDPADANSTLAPLETGPVRFDADASTSPAWLRELECGVWRVQRAVAAYLGTRNPPIAGARARA
jgi:hypothetical protein